MSQVSNYEKLPRAGLVRLWASKVYRIAVRWAILLALFGLGFGWMAAVAQETGRGKSDRGGGEASVTTELTEGLLDLLDESPGAGTVSEPANSSERFKLEPKDVGLESEDLGEQTNNPLAAVRQSMLIAAGYLSKGVAGTPTQTIQSDIVSRLDELIAHLESASEGSQPESSEASESQENSSQGETSFERREKQVEVSEQAPPEGQSENEMQRNAPGQTGVGANVIQRLSSPQALQQEVWGQLPERVRKQMQSKMVEQFLPSHREQIETYFRRLLQVQSRASDESRASDR